MDTLGIALYGIDWADGPQRDGTCFGIFTDDHSSTDQSYPISLLYLQCFDSATSFSFFLLFLICAWHYYSQERGILDWKYIGGWGLSGNTRRFFLGLSAQT